MSYRISKKIKLAEVASGLEIEKSRFKPRALFNSDFNGTSLDSSKMAPKKKEGKRNHGLMFS